MARQMSRCRPTRRSSGPANSGAALAVGRPLSSGGRAHSLMPKPRIVRRARGSRALDKRLLSPQFAKKAEKAIAQAATHGNTTHIYKILADFERTQSFRGLVIYFCERTGFFPEFEYGEVRLKRRTRPSASPLPLPTCLAQHKGRITDVLGPQARMTPASHVDALTPGIRLPGSYGTASRR